ncbi:phosphoserine phosphatase-like [Glandiceps talaboti]
MLKVCPIYFMLLKQRACHLLYTILRNRRTLKEDILPVRLCHCQFSTTANKMTTLEETKAIWKSADAVCFDVDSTVVIDEGIDELAAYLNKGKEVSEWTLKAMDGTISYRETLSARLQIIQPSRQQMEEFVKTHPPRFTTGVQDLMQALQSKNIDIFLVSGGLRAIIEPMAKILNVPSNNILCNRLKFYFNGDYAGFDEDQPTSREGGKPEVTGLLKKKHGYKKLVMIGDGATDLEACPPADAFIGFGGNQIRSKVKEQAAWFVTDFAELTEELK